MIMRACILSCTSLLDFVAAAQSSQGTDHPVFTLDRAMHVEPEEMKAAMLRQMAALPPEYDTVLVAMGFCGGVWHQAAFDRTVVIPRVDDCVSLLLHTDDAFHPNLKEDGHLYLYENDPGEFSALTLMHNTNSFTQDLDLKNMSREFLFEMWFHNYRHMDIIDTGLNDCYSEEYAAAAQAQADQIKADLDYVPGGILLLEKLVSGRWDEQFIVAPPGKTILHGDFFG